MTNKSMIEIADRKSRQRAILFGAATLIFLGVQVMVRPVVGATDAYQQGWRAYSWAFNIALLLMCLGGGGGIFNPARLRALINDEVAQLNYRRACSFGFWVSMLTGLSVYVVPALTTLNARETTYLVVTLGASAAMLLFSWLEYRAHADA